MLTQCVERRLKGVEGGQLLAVSILYHEIHADEPTSRFETTEYTSGDWYIRLFIMK